MPCRRCSEETGFRRSLCQHSKQTTGSDGTSICVRDKSVSVLGEGEDVYKCEDDSAVLHTLRGADLFSLLVRNKLTLKTCSYLSSFN